MSFVAVGGAGRDVKVGFRLWLSARQPRQANPVRVNRASSQSACQNRVNPSLLKLSPLIHIQLSSCPQGLANPISEPDFVEKSALIFAPVRCR